MFGNKSLESFGSCGELPESQGLAFVVLEFLGSELAVHVESSEDGVNGLFSFLGAPATPLFHSQILLRRRTARLHRYDSERRRMRMLGYGEDALTLWALSQRLPEFLLAVEDDSRPEDTVTFYRPSFGRRASGDDPSSRRAEFGEFDAIVGSSSNIYLIESKWSESGEVGDGFLTLREEQGRRHDIFREYVELWRQYRPSSWEEFEVTAAADFEEACPRVKFAPSNSRLRRNLEFVLRELEDRPGCIRDVVLLIRFDSGVAVPRIRRASTVAGNEEFMCVAFECDRVSDTFYVELATRPALTAVSADEATQRCGTPRR